MSKVILVSGEQNAGKTTWIKQQMENDKTAVHLEVHCVGDILVCVNSKSKKTYYLESNKVYPIDLPEKLEQKIEWRIISLRTERYILDEKYNYSNISDKSDDSPF